MLDVVGADALHELAKLPLAYARVLLVQERDQVVSEFFAGLVAITRQAREGALEERPQGVDDVVKRIGKVAAEAHDLPDLVQAALSVKALRGDEFKENDRGRELVGGAADLVTTRLLATCMRLCP